MPLQPGTRLGNYEVISPLGAGGMGEVYRARDVRLDRPVAIKALPDSFASDPERAARFEREAKTLASLSHPNIAVIYGIEDVSGASYLALELIEGETLTQRIARGPLDAAETLRVAAQIAAAIDAAHERGVVHRDLKPSNVMLTPAGVVKVLDFGLAKGTAAGVDASSFGGPSGATMTFAATPTADGVILGTAPYMSPEQARGKPVDRRTDVWALGCIVFECLTAKQVFPGETASDVLARILEREPDWSQLPASTPARLRDFLRRCLTKDAGERPRDAGDLRGELLAILADRPSPGGGAAPAVSDGGASPSIAVLYFENLSGAAESDYFCAGITEDILTDLSKIKGLRVASRNAVARFRGSSADIAQVARELGVGHVVEGSVRRAGDRVRISAQLVSADGFHLWAERYDRTLEDVFAVQEEIAKAITSALSVTLTPSEAKDIAKDRPDDVRAYDLYLKGRAEYGLYTAESMRQAIRWFEDAIALEPGYALAHAGLADALAQMNQWEWSDDPDILRRGLEAARRSVALDPSLAEAHKAEALVLGQMGDAEGSLAALRRALRANPRYLPALGNLGVHLYTIGDVAGAERAIRRARAIEPDSPFHIAWLGLVLSETGRFAETDALSDELESRKDTVSLTFGFGQRAWNHYLRGDFAGMAAAVERGRRNHADPGNLVAFEALVAAKSGQRDEARRHLAAALAAKGLNGGGIAATAAAAIELGEPEHAVEVLGRRILVQLLEVFVRLEWPLGSLLDRPAYAPRRSNLTLIWPVEAPMIDPARLALFKEVKIASGTPGGSSILDEE